MLTSPIVNPLGLTTQVICASFPAVIITVGLLTVIVTLSVLLQPEEISVVVNVYVVVVRGFAVGFDEVLLDKPLVGDQE